MAREADGNPTALCLGLLGVGRALQRKDPAAALALLDESAEVAASVRNRWFYAFARMYAAATHGVHSDPAMAATAFLEVLDAWERLGDWSQQWLSLLYVTRLLIRLGAAAEAVTLHYALVAAAKPAPFDADRLAALAESLGAERFDAAARSGIGHGRARGRRVRPVEPARLQLQLRLRLRRGAASSGAVTGPAELAASGGQAVGDRARPAGGQRDRPARSPRRRGGSGRPGTPTAAARRAAAFSVSTRACTRLIADPGGLARRSRSAAGGRRRGPARRRPPRTRPRPRPRPVDVADEPGDVRSVRPGATRRRARRGRGRRRRAALGATVAVSCRTGEWKRR